eukprot:TRINITY_DN13267_c0_g1_i1.p1 TRINITY_DN13267_c0_g1~~TRINITY_DN13267_c0_g1_i1.p1  ORF type:complete len:683 (+),score=151.27 TRINITY_DN13267_c0_g1_i1:212-2260(+)
MGSAILPTSFSHANLCQPTFSTLKFQSSQALRKRLQAFVECSHSFADVFPIASVGRREKSKQLVRSLESDYDYEEGDELDHFPAIIEDASQNGRPISEINSQPKKRGRKKKGEQETKNKADTANKKKGKEIDGDLMTENETANEVQSNDNPTPKKRGRRKKTELTVSMNNGGTKNVAKETEPVEHASAEPPSDISTVPKKRGRKKKTEEPKTNETAIEVQSSDHSTPKKRGRRKKTEVLESMNNGGTENIAKEIEPVQHAYPETPSNISTVPKKRGRRKKTEESKTTDHDIENTMKNINGKQKDETLEEGLKIQADTLIFPDSDGDDGDNYKYDWPPLVCCFGPVQNKFFPIAARHMAPEIHNTGQGLFYNPGDLARGRGGPSFDVAVKLAQAGAKVALIGKLGNDPYGRQTVIDLNMHNVQTRGLVVDRAASTSVSSVRIVSKSGKLGMECTRSSAEESLLSAEVNLKVLREAKLFYFNSMPFLSNSLYPTLYAAIQFFKTHGGNTFFDVNLPLPLWKSHGKTWKILSQFWKSSNFIKVTTQELEFLLGRNFSDKRAWMTQRQGTGQDRTTIEREYYHYLSDKLSSIWHDDLKLLMLNHGTSLLYYTPEFNGILRGYEKGALSFDRSSTNNAFVAAMAKHLIIHPEIINNHSYLEDVLRKAVAVAYREENFIFNEVPQVSL